MWEKTPNATPWPTRGGPLKDCFATNLNVPKKMT